MANRKSKAACLHVPCLAKQNYNRKHDKNHKHPPRFNKNSMSWVEKPLVAVALFLLLSPHCAQI
jgi:hypothetical protein